MAQNPTAENRLEPHKVIMFAENVAHVGQQRKSRLANFVTADLAFSGSGDRFTDELVGVHDMIEMFNDFGDTPDNDTDKMRRLAFFKTFADSQKVGKREQAEQLIDPLNPKVVSMGYALERQRDRSIIKGLYDGMYDVDDDGDIVKSAFSPQTIGKSFTGYHKGKADGDAAPGTAPTVLTPAKLRGATVLQSKAQIISMHVPHVLVEEEDLQNMLTSVEVSSADYNQLSRVIDGEIDMFKGKKLVRVEAGTLKTNAAGNTAYLPMYYPDQILFKERPLVSTRVGERPDKMYRWYAYMEVQHSVLRREDKGVIHIEVER